MLEEKDIAKHCDSRVLRRARNIARATDSIHSRRCLYEPGAVGRFKLKARVVSGQDWRQSYEVVVDVDDAAGKVRGYDCTCQAALSQMGMCKHVAAAALAFVAAPETYIGYDAKRGATSSEGITRLIEAARAHDGARRDGEGPDGDADGLSLDEHVGDIRLEVTLVHDAGSWALRLRVGDKRVRYAVRDLGAFSACLRRRSFASYGSKLAFTHSPEAFEAASRALALFVVRSVEIREGLESDQLSGFHVRPAELRGELALSTPELVELLGLADDVDLFVDDLNELSHKPRRTRIVEGRPPVRAVFEAQPDGGFTVKREGRLSFAQFGDGFYVWYGHVFYRCDADFARCRDFLQYVYCDPSASQYLSPADAHEFCARVLPVLDETIEVVEPDEMKELKPVPCEVELYFDYRRRTCSCVAKVRYGNEELDLLEDPTAKPQTLSRGMRDLVAERRVRALLGRYFPIVEGTSRATAEKPLKVSGADDIAKLLFKGLGELRAIATVYTTPAFDRLISRRRPHVVVGLSIRSGLIDLSVSADDFDAEELAAVLSSYRQRKRYHLLADGSYLDLQDSGLAQADALLADLDVEPERLAAGDVLFEPYRVFQLDGLVDDEGKTREFRRLVKASAAPAKRSHELPASLSGIMRPYQIEGFEWLNRLADSGFGGILADEMGLGKSLQLISFLGCRYAEDGSLPPSLIVCPASLVYNWLAEFDKFPTGLFVSVVVGGKDERLEAVRRISLQVEQDDAYPQVIITSYDLLKRDLDDYSSIPFDCIVLDEAQYIKNTNTQAARATKALVARHRFALTGTPVENRLSELWSIFDFLMPGLLGGYRQFRDRYEQPILGGDAAQMERLQALVSRFILRRLKKDVLKDLPSKSENLVYSQMGAEQRALYHAHEQRLRESVKAADGKRFASERIAVLAELTRLRELCCDPHLVYEDYDGSSAKLDTVLELIDTARASQAKSLVFSQFTSYLDLIAEQLRAHGVPYYTITGATPKRRRVELVDAFNADDTPVFLVSLKAGGTGLNLTGASVVIHADPWWNSAAENQATDRSHRIGQTREVSVYKVIAKDTIEERVVALQAAKRELADKLVEGAKAPAGALSREELLELLSG